ncbi:MULTISPECIES: diguanylate cyclase [unclassified Actinotalea]|uniref:GGDEF domain-containing protein n=1 Tax=unclassified Actinotalea TaxID=2638618 RepID=UPI0015F413A8|nr:MULTISPECIES: GGDEF domain-containing protein [unclassified Actinotalea]
MLTRRDEGRVLALACLWVGAVTAVTVVVPFSPTAPRELGAALATLALVLSAVLHLTADRVRRVHLHAVTALATGLIALCVAQATTPHGIVTTSVALLWPATYSAVFHRRRVLLRHLAWMAVALAGGLVAAGAGSASQTWFFLVVTFACVALVLNSRIVDLRLEATTDELTGVLSRRAFRVAAELEMARARRTGQPLSLAIVDLDDFKAINDERGHTAGDAVLSGLARSWQETLRPEDVVGRFGGDEFVVLMPRTDADGAQPVLSRMRSDLCDWSAGVATWSGESFEDWFAVADDRLYTAKPD